MLFHSTASASLTLKKFNQFSDYFKSLLEYRDETIVHSKTLTNWKNEWQEGIEKLPNPEQALTGLNLLVDILNQPKETSLIDKTESDLKNFVELSFFNKNNFHRLTILFSNTPTLARWFLKDPLGYKDDVFAPVQSVADFKIVLLDWLAKHTQPSKQTISAQNDTTSIVKETFAAIRILKIKSYLRICIDDYLGVDSFETTVEKISFFAEVAVRYALHYSRLKELPIAVIAMGKLGGNELNYNSDIDIMFVAGNDLSKHRNYKGTHDIIVKVQTFITLLSDFTANGLVYKVDLRIRPEGDQGPLYLTLEQYYEYYENRAQSWEFQALIKARAVGGDTEVGKQFEEFRRKWVFNPDFSSKKMLLSISRIKNNIEKFHKPQEYRDMKLAPGGIRDLEFIVQFLQIHHGKITRVLSYTNTLQSLDKFLTYKIITPRQHKFFRNHYCFLRQIEHYLQLVELLPIRSLPSEEKPLLVIARMMGYHTTEDFLEKIREVMNFNQDLFLRIFKLTTEFYEKIDEIKSQLLTRQSETTNEYIAYFSEHINHLESDYFINFSAQKIIKHIRLLQKTVNNNSVLELEFSHSQVHDTPTINNSGANNGGSVEIELITNDHKGIFSLICGLVALYGISILDGASFLYQKNTDSEKVALSTSMLRFDGIQARELSKLKIDDQDIKIKQLSEKLATKRVVFSMKGVFVSPIAEEQFKVEDFYNTLSEAIGEMEKKLSDKIMEKILFRSLTAFKKFGIEPNQEQLKFIQLNIDNTSHPLYTIVDIKSEDSFLFLFFFTYALSFKGYYIIKVEFSTPKHQIRNRIFLTDHQHGKIHDENKLVELKSSILLIKYFSVFMKDAPNPSLAYKTFNKLISSMAVKQYSENDHTDFYLLFKDLVKVLGTGEVIMEDFLRLQHNDIRTFLRDKKTISETMTLVWLQSQLDNFFAARPEQLPGKNLNMFKDQLLFHLDLRLLTGAITNFGNFCEEMSNLTDVVMTKTVEIALAQTLEKFELDQAPGHHAVVALGKWGSREMGYSSDVELVFIYDYPGHSRESNKTSQEDAEVTQDIVKDFYIFMGNLLPGIIESKKNGIFEVDLRLRPEGDNSAIATSLSKFKNYYAPGGRYLNYEKMVLTRLRVVSGDPKLSAEIEQVKNYFVYELDDFDVADFRVLREKQIAHLTHAVSANKDTVPDILNQVNIKFSAGGLVDIEYLVQILSIRFGKTHSSVRVNNTIGVVEGLERLKLIDKNTAERMIFSYKFLRNLINCLRIMRGNAKGLELPERGSLEMEYLKRTMLNFKAIDEKTDLYDKIRIVMEQVISLQKQYL